MSPPPKPFESRVQAGKPNECWPWLAGLSTDGYGQFYDAEKKGVGRAHRRAWEIANGPVPNGLCVLHRCDNTICCNPAHLFLGTSADNTADRHAKARDARGSGHGMSLLTERDVREIRRIYDRGGVTQTSLARRFGVTQGAVHLIVRRKNWRSIDA